MLGVCSAYAALIGMQLFNLTGIFDQRIWLLIASPIFVILALLPNLSVLSKFVPLGMLAACLTAVMVVWRPDVSQLYRRADPVVDPGAEGVGETKERAFSTDFGVYD